MEIIYREKNKLPKRRRDWFGIGIKISAVNNNNNNIDNL